MNRRQIMLGILGVVVTAPEALAGNSDGSFIVATHKRKKRYKKRAAAGSRYRGKQVVSYRTSEKPGTIIVNTRERALYFVLDRRKAIRYGVGVGRQGFTWKGTASIQRKAKWPAWYPPEAMRRRELRKGRRLPKVMKGGIKNPLGARALYLYRGGRDTLYRIHGTNNPSSIGRAASSGCVRLLNEEIVDLHKRVQIGAKVIVI